MKRPARLTAEEVAEKYTPAERSAIEREVQLRGAADPDNVRLPDGRTVTEARLDILDAVSLAKTGVSIYDAEEPAAEEPAAEGADDAPATTSRRRGR